VLIPELIDYETDQIDLALRYTDKKWQLQLAYYGSLFEDQNQGITFQNPYSTISGWTAPTGFPNGKGEISTPPDNEFHQFSVDGAYNFSEHTRLSASYARGRMTQDDTFLPYTAIPELQASVTQPLPRDSLDGEIDTTVATVKLSSRAWDRFFWNASYRYDDRDNDTPRDKYVYIGGDSQTQATSASSDRNRFNDPYSYNDEQFKLEGGYRIFGRTELTLGGEHRETERTYAERESADEDSIRAELRTGFSDWITGSLRWTRAERDGSTYNGTEPLHSGYNPEYVATLPGGFENPPALRKFNQADRTRDVGSMFVTVTPLETLPVQRQHRLRPGRLQRVRARAHARAHPGLHHQRGLVARPRTGPCTASGPGRRWIPTRTARASATAPGLRTRPTRRGAGSRSIATSSRPGGLGFKKMFTERHGENRARLRAQQGAESDIEFLRGSALTGRTAADIAHHARVGQRVRQLPAAREPHAQAALLVRGLRVDGLAARRHRAEPARQRRSPWASRAPTTGCTSCTRRWSGASELITPDPDRRTPNGSVKPADLVPTGGIAT
jgi:hypothetical protein